MHEEIREELQRLKVLLPKGYREKLAKEHGLTIYSIDKIFAGKWVNMDVLQSAAQMAEEQKKDMADMIERLKAI